ncbi:MAG: hypothetical protein E7359_02960 [Clostridiales bacterium]|nr:hypothetical protein [Clostridiales bacterium]
MKAKRNTKIPNKIGRDTKILLATLVSIPAALGIGLLFSPLVAGILVASVGFIGISGLTASRVYDQMKELNESVKKFENKEEIPYETLDKVDNKNLSETKTLSESLDSLKDNSKQSVKEDELTK